MKNIFIAKEQKSEKQSKTTLIKVAKKQTCSKKKENRQKQVNKLI